MSLGTAGAAELWPIIPGQLPGWCLGLSVFVGAPPSLTHSIPLGASSESSSTLVLLTIREQTSAVGGGGACPLQKRARRIYSPCSHRAQIRRAWLGV